MRAPSRTERHVMLLRYRTENIVNILDIDINEAARWLNVDLSCEPLTQEEMEQRIQDACDEQYNRPEYNNYHRETRYIDPTPKARRLDGKKGYIQKSEDDDEDFDFFDHIFKGDPMESLLNEMQYNDICTWIREKLTPKQAEMFITIRMDGMGVTEYAKKHKDTRTNIAHKLMRIEKILRTAYIEENKKFS